MHMQKEAKSFRLSKKAIEELDVLMKIELSQSEVLGIKPSTMTEIIERGINTMYTMVMDETAGDNYLSRMTSLIRDAVNQGMSSNDFAFNSIIYELAVVKELLYTQMKAGAYPKDEATIHKIVKAKSVYEPIVEEKINERLK